MAATIEILTGVAACGKTARLVDEYRLTLKNALDEQRPGNAIWLTPTSHSRRLILDSLLNGSLPACFSPNIFTFKDFATKILESAGESIFPLNESIQRTLVRYVVDDLLRKKQLPYFASIAHTSGFLDVVIGFISELKREETWPEHFFEACAKRGTTNKDRELSLIYEGYQQQLHELSFYDAEGRFWSARSVLEGGSRGPFPELALVVIDGFTDFTHTQFEILAHLAGFTGRMLITLPLEPPPNRTDLFAKTALMRNRLLELSSRGCEVSEVPCRHDDHPVDVLPAFTHISDHLFANLREMTPAVDTGGIEIFEVTGQINEVQVLAEQVKKLLLKGTPPEEIVVAIRSLTDYAPLITELFSASGIPFWCEADTPMVNVPIVRALFSVLHLERDDWAFDRLMAVLDSNYFRPDWKERGKGVAVRAVAAELRRLKLSSERIAILRRLKSEATHAAEKLEAVDQQPSSEESPSSNSAAALALLQRLSETTAALRRKNNFPSWVKAILDVAGELGITPENDIDAGVPEEFKQRHARESKIWNVFRDNLENAVEIHRLVEQKPRKINLGEFCTQLADMLRIERIPASKGASGTVRVMDATQVRNLEIPYLFLAGLTETSFPQGRSDDCLYNETERQQLNQQGLSLGHRSSRNQDEMLLFYGIVTRARKQLVLSYPAISTKGQPLFPSPYLTALRDLFDPKSLQVIQAGRLDPVPDPECILTSTDLRVAAVVEARRKRPGLFRAMLDQNETANVARNILASVELTASRFYTPGFTPYEGLLQNPANMKELRGHFEPDYEFSATQLELYAECPFRFFASNLLKIDSLESPEVGTDFRKRGIVVHDVLASMYQRAFDEEPPIAGFSVEEISSRFLELVEEKLGRSFDDSELKKALTHIERELLAEWGEAYATQWDEYLQTFEASWDVPPQPRHLEVPFGNPPGDTEESTAHRLDSLELGSTERKTRVRGRIDRIDVGVSDGQNVFNVIDYKTGTPSSFSPNDISSGKALQLALYTLAVQRLEIAGDDCVPFQMGFWSVKESGFIPGIKQGRRKVAEPIDAVVLESLDTMLDELIPRLADGIREGKFPVYSTDENCMQYCPYKTVCRVNQIRSLPDSLHKQFEL